MKRCVQTIVTTIVILTACCALGDEVTPDKSVETVPRAVILLPCVLSLVGAWLLYRLLHRRQG